MMEKQTAKKTKQRSIIRRILLVIIGLALGVNVYLANAKGIVGNQLPMPFGYGLANVLSGSMEPTFSKGALLLVKESDEIEIGDIVVYQSGQELIVHRVIAQKGDTIITKGDANNAADPPFQKGQIKGVVIGWVGGLGTIAGILKTPVAIIGMILAAIFLMEGSFRKQKDEDDQELEKIKEEIRRLKDEKNEES